MYNFLQNVVTGLMNSLLLIGGYMWIGLSWITPLITFGYIVCVIPFIVYIVNGGEGAFCIKLLTWSEYITRIINIIVESYATKIFVIILLIVLLFLMVVLSFMPLIIRYGLWR